VRAEVPTMGYLVPGARIEASGFQNGGYAPINYTLTGPTDKLDEGANKLKALIAKEPSALDAKTSTSNAGPRMEVAIDRDRAALLDVSPEAAAQTARAGIGGIIATKLRMPEGLIDAVVRLPSVERNDLPTVEGLDVRSMSGRLVPLSDVSTFKWTTEPTMIQREDRQRTVTVSANTINGAPIGPITSRVQAALAQPNFLPEGVSVKPEGDVQLQQETGAQIGLALLTSFLLIYMLMVILYRSYLTPFIIMFSVPLAFIGVLGFLLVINIFHSIFPNVQYLKGQTLNLFSELGVVMLMGLVAKTGILLVDYANTMIPSDRDDHRRDDLRHAPALARSYRWRGISEIDRNRHHRRSHEFAAADAVLSARRVRDTHWLGGAARRAAPEQGRTGSPRA
jgi:multidrug efflux pump subunit AcrB